MSRDLRLLIGVLYLCQAISPEQDSGTDEECRQLDRLRDALATAIKAAREIERQREKQVGKVAQCTG